MSLANQLSIFRLLLVPGIIACLVYYDPQRDWLRLLALGLFAVGMASDAVDGYVARSKAQWTRLGSFLDPLADKLLLLTAFLSLALIRDLPQDLRVPAWVVIVFVSRESFVVIGCLLLYHLTGRLEMLPSRLGKWAAFLQMLVVPVVLLRWPWAPWVWTAAAALTIISGVNYLRRGGRLLSGTS